MLYISNLFVDMHQNSRLYTLSGALMNNIKTFIHTSKKHQMNNIIMDINS